MSLFRKPNKQGVDCAGACEMMFDYLDGQLSADESALLTRHLEECDKCRDELEQRKKTLNLIQNVDFSVPDELYPNVMSLIGAAAQDRKKIYISRGKFLPLGGFVAACAVAVLVLLNRGGMPDISTASDQTLMKSNAVYCENDTAGEDLLTDAVPKSFFGANMKSDSDGASNEPDNRDYAGSTSVLTLSPNLNEDSSDKVSERSADLFSVYLDSLKEEHAESAIIVCDSIELQTVLNEDGASESASANASESGAELFVFTAGGADDARNDFTGYLNLLRNNGDSFESYMPEDAGFTTYYILLFNSAETDPTTDPTKITTEVTE